VYRLRYVPDPHDLRAAAAAFGWRARQQARTPRPLRRLLSHERVAV
jgi:hypothetical protein